MGRRLTVDRMLLAGALFIVLAIAIRPALDNDLWWHLRSGRWMVDHRRILGADPFSHTADGDRRLPFDWLAQLGLYGVWGVGGLWLVAVATGVAATASVALTVLAVPGAGDRAGRGGRPDRRRRLGVLVGPSPDRHQPPRRGGGLGAVAAPPDRRRRVVAGPGVPALGPAPPRLAVRARADLGDGRWARWSTGASGAA